METTTPIYNWSYPHPRIPHRGPREGWVGNKTTIEDTFSIKDTYNVQALPAILLLSQNVILVELLILKTIALHQTCQT